ncbi:MAG: glycosyltransferase [Azonexus sp.]
MIERTEPRAVLEHPVKISEQNWPEGTEPVVSICCITYNHEHFLVDCLEGFLRQETSFPVEILLHDDASTDATPDIVKRYAEKYPQVIKPICQKVNQWSQGKKINPEFNFPRARGEFLALCEGDDYWSDETKLQQQVDCLRANPAAVICYGKVIGINQHGAPVENYADGESRDLTAEELKRAPSINTSTVCFRNVGIGNPRELCLARVEDVTIWSRLGKFGSGIFMAAIKPGGYRLHEGGIFSMKTAAEKENMYTETILSLYWFHRQNGDEASQAYFARKLVKLILAKVDARVLVSCLFFAMKRLLSTAVRAFGRCLRMR